jgi:hypothetical protein
MDLSQLVMRLNDALITDTDGRTNTVTFDTTLNDQKQSRNNSIRLRVTIW